MGCRGRGQGKQGGGGAVGVKGKLTAVLGRVRAGGRFRKAKRGRLRVVKGRMVGKGG